MPTAEPGSSRPPGFVTFVTVVLVIAILHVAREVVVPVSLSVLLAFLLTPLVNRLARWGLPNPLAIGLTATLGFAVIGSVGWTVVTQTVAVLEELPRHEENMRAKVAALNEVTLPGPLSRTKELVESLRRDAADAIAPAPEPARGGEKPRPPVTVAIAEDQATPLDVIRQMVAPALGPLGTGAIVIVFVVMILFQRHDLRDRFVKLISAGRINMAAQAVDDAARRVSRYLGMQLLVNAAYGLPVGIGLHVIGVPGAILWGVLATVLRFIPYLGPWIAAACPLALAAAIDPGWTKLLYTAGLFIVLEIISNNVVEVLVYGASTGISSFALLVAAVFWTWLWGIAGLFLSTPLTVCLLVMGKYVPGLKFLNILLGSEPPASPPALLYQRMLLMNYDQMHDLATNYVAEHSLVGFYDDVFVPALVLAGGDRQSGALAGSREQFILQASRELIDDLARDAEEAVEKSADGPVQKSDCDSSVLAIPASDDADELVALMLQSVLRLRGVEMEVSPFATLNHELAATTHAKGTATILISALPPSALVTARRACRRVRTEISPNQLLVGLWNRDTNGMDLKTAFRRTVPDEIFTSLAESANWLEDRHRDEPLQIDKEHSRVVANTP